MNMYRSARALYAAAASTHQYSKRWVSSSTIPVGIFLDLDNVAPTTFSRQDAQDFVSPLEYFAESIPGGKLSGIYGFGNRPTQTWVSQEEKERDSLDQEWDGTESITGYDETGNLRCGVCGAKMKLTKKDKAKGLDEQMKLDKHMQMLHDREQAKRKNKRKTSKRKKLTEKELKKFRKYESATVGLGRIGVGRRGNKNDLFAVLKEQGVKCRSCDNVDATLERMANKWMDLAHKDTGREAEGPIRGCVVVVSEDSDFVPLLKRAKSQKFLAVSVTSYSTDQTRKLVQASDIVLKMRGDEPPEYPLLGHLLMQPCSSLGKEFVADMTGEEIHSDGKVDIESTEQYEDFDDVLDAFFEKEDSTLDLEDYLDDEEEDSVVTQSLMDEENLQFFEWTDTPDLDVVEDYTEGLDWDGNEEFDFDFEESDSDVINSDIENDKLQNSSQLSDRPLSAKKRKLMEDVKAALSRPCETTDWEKELRHRALECGLLAKKKPIHKVALMLHYASIGRKGPPAKKRRYGKWDRKQLKRYLKQHGDCAGGSKKEMRQRVPQYIRIDEAQETEARARKVLEERGLSTRGGLDQMSSRLIRSLLGLPEEN